MIPITGEILSTPERPKPFLPLLAPVRDGEPETLVQRTVRRLLDGPELGGLERTAITVVAAAAHAPHVRTQLPGVTVIEEPVGRNTAPAIALAAMAPGDDEAVMAVLPADHLIEREAAFRAVLRTSRRASGDRRLLDRRPACHAGRAGVASGDRVRLPHPRGRPGRHRRRP